MKNEKKVFFIYHASFMGKKGRYINVFRRRRVPCLSGSHTFILNNVFSGRTIAKEIVK